MNEGLGLRTPEGFRFVCPAAWGGDGIVPAQAIPTGPAIIGAASGLFVADDSAVITRHPDPAALGFTIALGASSRALFALRVQGDLHEVLRVEPERVRILWSSERRWDDIAVGNDLLYLVRLEENIVHVVRLSPEGELIDEDQAALPMPCSAVLARIAGSVPYAVALDAALDAQLGRVERGAWVALASARMLGGPIEAEDGARLVALDGVLAGFDDEQVAPLVPLAEPDFITCLRRQPGLAYACSDRGLRRVGIEGLGASLFELDQLIEPDLESVRLDQRDACALQWQRYQIDLRSVGALAAATEAGSPAAGQPPDSGTSDAGRDSDAGSKTSPRDRSGCQAGRSGIGDFGSVWIMVAIALLARRSR